MEMSPPKTIKDIQRLVGGVVVFKELKLYLTSPPLLKSPYVGETLYLYLATSEETIVTVLVKLEGVHQFLVYYVSKVLQNNELRYSKIEKCIYALIVAAHKLQPHFQAHPIVVVTNQPMNEVLPKVDAS
ncbi:rve domain-containing protein/RVT_3 domain-containing protein [Gossypium australe]|uniref:Rve domain-containing protein/RVT_3 domain-containing protein n=1 Tax=Gossypium australe TaxID=47621 RepID=A0A5B6VW49_9ROSI|nr:rve domain-containing protein/RVT_3 domain-containing protein [Gossypium australe]